jgi:predicted TIM-barrel fold metal-dependent hydrolase
VYETLGADRMLFAVDYPYESMADGAKFIDEVKVRPGDLDKICHGNVEKLLKL